MALRRTSWCDLMQANLLICADFAGWTGWEVLTVLEFERVKMVVVCRSAGTVVHLESLQRDWIMQKCCVDFPPVVKLQLKVG